MSEFNWPVRIYYEDTDAGGVVFNANYLKYLERARTEWLLAMGYGQTGLMKEFGIIFAVRRVEIDYLLPAKLDDALTVVSTITKVSGASLIFEQRVQRDQDQSTLCDSVIKIACLSQNELKPTAIPKEIREKFKNAKQ